MSLIDQALKKTQSSLRGQNKPGVDPLKTPEPERHIPLTAQRVANSFKRRRISNRTFTLPTINKYWMIGIGVFIAVALMCFEIVSHFSDIKGRYANFYKTLYSDVTFQHGAGVNSTQPLILNGTMEMNGEHVALINGNLYHAGESVNGYLIKQVHYNYVALQNPATHRIRELSPSINQ
jgi:hypothetical protein